MQAILQEAGRMERTHVLPMCIAFFRPGRWFLGPGLSAIVHESSSPFVPVRRLSLDSGVPAQGPGDTGGHLRGLQGGMFPFFVAAGEVKKR